jgi:uncharacterized protein
VQVDQYGLEVLDAAACRALLATKGVGRIGTSIDALPVIVPVHYAVDGDFVVLRMRADTRLDKALVGCVVCFEVDSLDDTGEYDWGVNVTGEAEGVYADEEVARLDTLGVPDLVDHARWVRIPTTVIVGRRRL